MTSLGMPVLLELSVALFGNFLFREYRHQEMPPTEDLRFAAFVDDNIHRERGTAPPIPTRANGRSPLHFFLPPASCLLLTAYWWGGAMGGTNFLPDQQHRTLGAADYLLADAAQSFHLSFA